MNAEQMWKEQGFNLLLKENDRVIYSDTNSINELDSCIIEINRNGEFSASVISHSFEGEALDFNSDMTRSLIQQLKEFEFKI